MSNNNHFITNRSVYYSLGHEKMLRVLSHQVSREFQGKVDADELFQIGWFMEARYHQDITGMSRRIVRKMRTYAYKQVKACHSPERYRVAPGYIPGHTPEPGSGYKYLVEDFLGRTEPRCRELFRPAKIPRNRALLRQWLNGYNERELGDKFNLTIQGVSSIIRRFVGDGKELKHMLQAS